MFGFHVYKDTGGAGMGAATSGDVRDRSNLRQQLEEIEWLAWWFFVFLFVFVFIYAGADCWSQTDRRWVFLHDIGILFSLMAASAVIGGFLGFLFGIPRSLQGKAPQPIAPAEGAVSEGMAARKTNQANGRAFTGNSNLEEISDWLTKIIVGVGLVQAEAIYTKMSALGDSFQNALPHSSGAKVIFFLIFAASLIGGFLFLYLETRTRVMWLFTDAEVALSPEALQGPRIQGSLKPINETDGLTLSGPAPEDSELLKVRYDALSTAEQLAAWGSAQARVGRYEAAAKALQDALTKQPGNKDLLLRLADVRSRQGLPQIAAAAISEAGINDGDDVAVLKRELLNSLYLPAPDGFRAALSTGQRLVAQTAGMSDPFVHLWIAAAEGQRYSWLVQTNGSDADKDDARLQALAEVNATVRFAPDPTSPARVLLRTLLEPDDTAKRNGNDDLEGFRNDPEFRQAAQIEAN